MSTENSAENTSVVEATKKEITSQVLTKIKTFVEAGELKLPKDYSSENALKMAYIKLTENSEGKGALIDKCDKTSIAEALLKMVVYGLTPQKNQVYFVPYGNKLNCMISYMGNITTAIRYNPNIKDIKAFAVTKEEDFDFEFDYEAGKTVINKHKRTLQSIGSKDVVGAYTLIYYKDGSFEVGDVMNFDQIKQAWNQGAMKGGSPAHRNFPDEMAKRTVINRTCKKLINTSSDAILMEDELVEEQLPTDTVKQYVKEEINMKAYAEEVSFEEVSFEEFDKTQTEEELLHFVKGKKWAGEQPTEINQPQPGELFESKQPGF